MNLQDFKKNNLPDTPGVYFFRLGKDILYIGKATSIKNRLKSYFSKELIQTRGPMIVDMVFRADAVTFQKTDTVIEALILEALLIKEYMPHYNAKEKDDKSWNYVCITKELLPKVLVERGKNIDFTKKANISGKKFRSIYGPFTSGLQLKEALKIIRRIFPYIDASSMKRDNYEFYRQLGLTPDVSKEDTQSAYKRSIRNIELFFSGKKKALLKILEKDMRALSKDEKFEECAKVRNQIFALRHINDVSLIKNDITIRREKALFRIEAYDVAHLSGKNMVGVMTVIEDGKINKKEYRTFNIHGFDKANDTGALEEVLSRRLRHIEWSMPDLIVTDGGAAQLSVLRRVLDRYQFKISGVSVVKDERHKPKNILGKDTSVIRDNERMILLANSEAHRFSIRLHKKKRDKNFLKELTLN